MSHIIQVAGVIDQAEAKLLMEAGVTHLGFPLRLPVNAIDHTEEQAREIIKTITPPFNSVIITYQSLAEDIIGLLSYLGTNKIQLHGDIALSELKKLKETRPDIIVYKSLIIGKSSDSKLLTSVKNFSPFIDAFITDTYNPKTGASGATGLTHDWSISRKLVLASPKPVILAGGINPDNVYDAIMQVKPAGVDVHTGVEEDIIDELNPRKDQDKVRLFVNNAKRAFQKRKTVSDTETGQG